MIVGDQPVGNSARTTVRVMLRSKALAWVTGPDPREVGDEPDPRFSYANERTYLAWNRTSLALISVGLAVSHLLPPFGWGGARRLIALPLMLAGVVVAVLSLREWGANERAMRLGQPLRASALPKVLMVVITVVGAIAIIASLVPQK